MASSTTVRVFLVESRPVMLAGLHAVLADAEGFSVVGEGASGVDAVRAIRGVDCRPQVILVDLRSPADLQNGAVRAITSTASSHILAMVGGVDDGVVIAALQAGVHGFMTEDSSPEELRSAVQIVAEGGAVFSTEIAERLGSYFSNLAQGPGRVAFPELTDRELEILGLIAVGHNNRWIARHLVLSDNTVRNHITNIFSKLRVPDRSAAIMRARSVGLGIS
jgi:DNA-binding NarL/FixJ family response regulator